MSSASTITPISTPQPDQNDPGILAHAPHRSDTQTHDDEPCEHNGLTTLHSVSPYEPAHGGNNADNTSLVPSSSSPSRKLSSTSSSPALVAGEASLFDIAHEIPLPPSPASSFFRGATPIDKANQIPLPPSATSSVVSENFPFDKAHEVPLPPSESDFKVEGASAPNESDAAYEIPLPPSTASSIDSVHPVNSVSGNPAMRQRPIGDEPEDSHGLKVQRVFGLQTTIGEISKWLPHLEVLFSETDMDAVAPALVKTYRISGTTSIFEEVGEVRLGRGSTWDGVQDCLSGKPLTLGTERLVLVEDFCPFLFENLYAAFGIGPEIFAEHLNRSGYGSSTYTDPDPSTWNFRSPKKRYVSIRWYRPVYKEETVGMPASARIEFLQRHQAEWHERRPIQSGYGEPRSARLTHKLMRCTSIRRRERPLSSAILDPWETPNRKTMVTIEERVTLYTEERQGKKTSVVFLDPLPYLRYSRTIEAGAEDDAQEEVRCVLPVLPIQSRSPPPVSSVDELLRSGNSAKSKAFFETPTSMLQDIEAWMAEYDNHSIPENANRLFIAILEIISRDTRTTFSLLTAALSEISLGSMDDSQGEELLAYWQTLIRSYQTDLPLMRNSLDDFVSWGFSGNVPSYMKNKVDDLASQTDDLIQRVEKAHHALRAELSILESKRGIAEAEGVARLTELAFIFIPLTFSASLFSMQVREFQEPMPTLAGFVGACLLFLGLSYGVRLAVRSRVLLDWKRELFQRIRADSELASKNVPTRIFVTWIFKQVWTFAFFFISAILAPTVALIWTKSKIDKGLKTVFTILLIGFAVAVGLYAVIKRFSKFSNSFFDFVCLFSTSLSRRRAEAGESRESV